MASLADILIALQQYNGGNSVAGIMGGQQNLRPANPNQTQVQWLGNNNPFLQRQPVPASPPIGGPVATPQTPQDDSYQPNFFRDAYQGFKETYSPQGLRNAASGARETAQFYEQMIRNLIANMQNK